MGVMTTIIETKDATGDQLASVVEELKSTLERDGKLTHELQKKFDGLTGDVVHKDEYKKLEAEVTVVAKSRADLEAKMAAMEKKHDDLQKIAEEASLKAGRLGSGGDADGPRAEQIEHKNAFVSWLRDRDSSERKHALKEIERKDVTGTVPAQGGFAVPEMIATDIDSKLLDESTMLSLVDERTVGTSDYKKLVNKGGTGYGWVGETDARPETGTSSLYEATFPMGTIYAYPEATEESLDDLMFDVEGWITEDAGIGFANGIDVAVISGDGSNKPLGFLATAPVADDDGARTDKVLQYLPTGAAADFGADAAKNLIDLVYRVRGAYRASSAWVMNSLTTAQVRVIQDGDGRRLWTDSLVAGQPALLAGYAVSTAEAMPDFAADAHPIGFGDLRRAYTVVRRHGRRVTRDEVTKPGYVKWHIRERLGGAVTNDDAFKVLKVAAS